MSDTPETKDGPHAQTIRCTGCSREIFHDGSVAGLAFPCPYCGQTCKVPDDPRRHGETKRTFADALSNFECSLYGQAPVQGDGFINGLPFYFRAKWDSWSFTLSLDPQIDPSSIGPNPERNGFFTEDHEGCEGFNIGADYADASYMKYDVAEALIRDCVRQFSEAMKSRDISREGRRVKLLVVGATGLIGRHVLDLALDDDRIAEVIAPTRRDLPQQPKLQAPLVNFDRLPEDAAWWEVDAVICALGTTMKAAGSQPAFIRVDYDYPLDVARLAKKHGVRTYVLNSSLGADPASRTFYLKVKGELERDLAALGFKSLIYARPGLLGGERQEFRLAERIATFVLTLLGSLIPKRWRINPALTVASALLEAAIAAQPGVHVIPSDQLIGTA